MKTLKLLAPTLLLLASSLLASVAGWGQTATQTPTQTPPTTQAPAPAQTPAPNQPAAPADPFVGDWRGTIASTLPIVVHITLNSGAYAATTDSPNQNVTGIPTTVQIDGATITIHTMAATSSSFTGTINGDTIVGNFTERGTTVPLTLTRAGADSQPLAGDWQGTVAGSVPLILHIVDTGRGYRASTDSPSHGISGIRTAITVNGSAVKLQIASTPPAQFVGTYDGSTLAGAFSQGRNSTNVTFTRSADAASSPVVGDWQGNVTDLIPLVFHIRATGRGFVATTDSPNLGKTNIRTQIAVNGNAVKLRIGGQSPAVFTGVTDGNTLTGTLASNGSSVRLTMERVSK
jgi:hypothetical protein